MNLLIMRLQFFRPVDLDLTYKITHFEVLVSKYFKTIMVN